MPTEFSKTTASSDNIDSVKTFLAGLGINTDKTPIMAKFANGVLVYLMIGDEGKEAILTAQQQTDIQTKYPQLTQKTVK